MRRSTYAASASPQAVQGLVLPKSSNLIVSIHNYFPYDFSLGRKRKDWGNEADKQALEASLDFLKATFVAKGIPVVLGEWGSQNQGNLADRVRHAEFYVSACLSRKMCPIWWDNGSLNEFGILDRRLQKWRFPGIADAIVKSVQKDQKQRE